MPSDTTIDTIGSSYIVIGKLGDHCKKLIELTMVAENEPHLAKSVKLEIDAIQNVISGWPMKNEANRSKLPILLAALEIAMRDTAHSERNLRTEVKHGQDQVLILRYASIKYFDAMDRCRTLIKQMNLISESGLSLI